MNEFSKRCGTISYVDNLELLARALGPLQQGVLTMQTWTEMWKLELDQEKSYFGPARLATRKKPKCWGECVNLQKTYERNWIMEESRSVKSQTQRFTSLDSIWPKLRRCLAPNWQKQRLLRQALWPKAFYGVSICTIGWAHIKSLRTEAMKALGYQMAGAAPGLRLGLLCHEQCDPGFYQAWHVLTTFRRIARKRPSFAQMWKDYMDRLMAGWSKGLLQNYWRSVNSFVGPLMHRELLMPMAVGIFGLKWMRRCCMSWWRMPGHGRFSWRFRRERILRAFRVSTDESFSKHMHEYVLTSCTLFGASKMDPSWSPHSMSSTTWAKPQLALSVVLLIQWNIDALRVPDVNMFMPNIMGFCRSGPHSQRQSKYIFYHRKIPTGSLANRRLCRWRINGTDRRSTLNQNYVIFLLTVPVMEGGIDSIN